LKLFNKKEENLHQFSNQFIYNNFVRRMKERKGRRARERDIILVYNITITIIEKRSFLIFSQKKLLANYCKKLKESLE